MNKAKRVAGNKHRKRQKKIAERRHAQGHQGGSQMAVASARKRA